MLDCPSLASHAACHTIAVTIHWWWWWGAVAAMQMVYWGQHGQVAVAALDRLAGHCAAVTGGHQHSTPFERRQRSLVSLRLLLLLL